MGTGICVWVYGYLGIRMSIRVYMYGYMGIWVYGYMGKYVWVYGYMGIWVYGYICMGIYMYGLPCFDPLGTSSSRRGRRTTAPPLGRRYGKCGKGFGV
jgi:hypothetical protein